LNQLTASIHVEASPDRVFEHFTRPDALMLWMGEHAVLDPHPGGEFSLDIRGVPVRGQYLEVDPPHRLLISWGHAGSDHLPHGASLLEVRFQPTEDGTIVTIRHSGLPEPEATGHRHGWAYFLDLLATAAGRQHASVTSEQSRDSPCTRVDRQKTISIDRQIL
jgi:uncharacterized protein YndB with AHSA1/START domain